MKDLIENFESEIDRFKWNNESKINDLNKSSESKDVFAVVCLEIAKFYSRFGFKASKKGIKYAIDGFTLKFNFSSSRSNEIGEWVWLEINSGVYPDLLVKKYKEENERLLPIIFSNVVLLDEKENSKGPTHMITAIGILGNKGKSESKYAESTTEYSRGLNIQNLSIDDFKMILKYINRIIEKSILLTRSRVELINYLKNPTRKQAYWINEKRFTDYLLIYYPDDTELRDLISNLA